jgi:multidrug resistance efflux pump
MIKALCKRTRPDNLVNQVRAGGKSLARRVYLGTVGAAVAFIALQFIGPMIFLEADGLAVRDTQVVAADFVGKVASVHIKPGDTVEPGTLIAIVHSHDSNDKIADVSAKLSGLTARVMQIEGRLRSLDILRPIARDRTQKAKAALAKINDLAARQLTTSVRIAEVTRELFDAEREETQIASEWQSLRQEIDGVARSRDEMGHVLKALKAAYNDGRIVAPTHGTVGARVVLPGTVISRGAALTEIYYGDAHVKAFIPHGRLYGLDAGERVVVTDGVSRKLGRIERVEAVSDQLPQEFQSNFKSVERQQIMRIALEGDLPFPVPSKVKVMGRFTPGALISLARSAVTVATGPLEAASIVASEISGREHPALVFDQIATGSINRRPASD